MVTQAAARQHVLVITGMSGAGKSGVANVLEDLGWFVVDNLPPSLLPALLDTIDTTPDSGGSNAMPVVNDALVALVADVRGGVFFRELAGALDTLEKRPGESRPTVLFLTASDEALVRRFESSRRPHPLQGQGRILDGVLAERELLADVRASADMVIDTSTLNIHQLGHRVRSAFGSEPDRLHLLVMSFGFKYGIPVDTDMVADLRFLPNPYWVPDLRDFTGKDAQVSEYVMGQRGAAEFLDGYTSLLRVVTAGYLREGKRLATVAVGCTGGKHRSVAMSLALAERLSDNLSVSVVHRDLGRE